MGPTAPKTLFMLRILGSSQCYFDNYDDLKRMALMALAARDGQSAFDFEDCCTVESVRAADIPSDHYPLKYYSANPDGLRRHFEQLNELLHR